MFKVCTKCQKSRPETEFYKRSQGSGYRSTCKECCGNYKTIVCSVCKKEHSRYALNRKSDVCGSCYPRYRQAYGIYHSAMQRSRKDTLDFNITLDWILAQGEVCPRTGIQFTYEDNGSSYINRKLSTPSIDKIDPSKGYTTDNCQLVCWWYNSAKQQFTDEEVVRLCRRVVIVSDTKYVQSVKD